MPIPFPWHASATTNNAISLRFFGTKAALNDINEQHITEADALSALESASSGAIAEGNVGGGTGMICYEFKGGTGTSSRHVTFDGNDNIVAALVQANHGLRRCDHG